MYCFAICNRQTIFAKAFESRQYTFLESTKTSFLFPMRKVFSCHFGKNKGWVFVRDRKKEKWEKSDENFFLRDENLSSRLKRRYEVREKFGSGAEENDFSFLKIA